MGDDKPPRRLGLEDQHFDLGPASKSMQDIITLLAQGKEDPLMWDNGGPDGENEEDITR